jgi:hypothetical protein
MTSRITPIFLFAIQRSGSTVTQRMIATHPDVATSGESWVLLPLLYSLRERGVYAQYAHRLLHTAIHEFCAGLPEGVASYEQEVRELALRLYRAHAGDGARYFLDKTPRYHVIAGEIVKLFPDAKFIFLWRNPLAIVSSHIETWGGGRWNLYEFIFDLYDGLEALVKARELAGEKAISVRFEDLVQGSPEARERLFRQLGLEFDAKRTSQFQQVQLPGRMWDPTGTKRYRELSQEPVDRWKTTLASPVRKWWCRRYLRWIGSQRLTLMGYDFDSLLRELDAVPSRYATVPSDVLRMLFGLAVRCLEPWVMRDKFRQFMRGERLHALS